MATFIIPLAVFLCVASLVGAIALFVTGSSESGVEDRLAVLTGSTSKSPKDLMKGSVLSQPLDMGQTDFLARLSRMASLNRLIEQADKTITPVQFFGITGALAIVGACLPSLAGMHPTIGLAVGVTLALLPLIWLVLCKRKRMKQFAKQLPDALELVSRALRAGHSLASGFNLIADEMKPPISKEFRRVFEEQNLGIPLEDALDNMTDRITNMDLRFFATAVVLQRQTGGDLAEILDKIGYLVRERFKIWGQVQALTGEGRLSGIVLLALPPALFVTVYKLNPEYVLPLFTDPMGRKMLAGGIVMQFLGALVIKKIVNIKV